MKSDNALVIALPPAGASRDGDAHWWRIIGGEVVESGDRIDSLSPTRGGHSAAGSTHILGLAPVSATLLHQLALPALGARQASAVARRTIGAEGLTPAEALHVVAAHEDQYLSVPRSAMQAWQEWGTAHALPFDSIVPAGLLIGPDGDTARRAQIGPETLIRSGSQAFVADPALVEALIGNAPITTVPRDAIERAMVWACDDPPAELLAEDFAPRSGPWLGAKDMMRAAMLTAAIVFVSLAIPVTQWVKSSRDTQHLDDSGLNAAAQLLSPTPPIDRAVAALDTKLAAQGGGGGILSTPLAALTKAMESAPTVAIDTLTWRGDGVLSVTLGAPRNEDINPVLMTLQSSGYRITAQPRTGSDGRNLADITMRSAP